MANAKRDLQNHLSKKYVRLCKKCTEEAIKELVQSKSKTTVSSFKFKNPDYASDGTLETCKEKATVETYLRDYGKLNDLCRDCKIAAGNDYNGNTAVGNHKFKDDDYASIGKLVKCIHNTLYEEKEKCMKQVKELDAEIRECANRLGEYLAKNLGTKESFEKE